MNYTLTDAKLKALKFSDRPPQKPKKDGTMPKPNASFKISDGGGLFVRISAEGTKAWAYAYSFNGKPKEVGLGQFPEISIKAARDLHAAARTAVAEGRDPADEKKTAKRKARDGDGTFGAVAAQWIKANKAVWKVRTAERIEATMKRDILPHLGKMQLTAIKPDHVRPILKAKAAKHPTAATVIRSIIMDIYETAISNGECEECPATKLTKVIVRPPVVHHRKLKEPQLGVWWNALESQEGPTQASTINATKFIALTMCRKSEVLNATWADISGLDGDEPMFVIPPERMKMKREHRVPIPNQAVAILRAQAEGRKPKGSEFIFTTLQRPTKPINISTLNALFNRVATSEGCDFILNADGKSDFSPHGLRGSATTILRERGYARDLVELLLAHAERGVHAAYNAAEQLPVRRAALQFYADLIDSLAAAARGENVVMLKKAA